MKHTSIICLSIITLFILIHSSQAYIIQTEPKPEYCEDCIRPLNELIKEENMATKELYQIAVIVSMLLVNLGLVYLMYLNVKKTQPESKFDMQYLIYALLGVVIGFNWFLPLMKYEGTYLEIFFSAAAFAIAGEGLINKGRKAAEAVLKSQNINTDTPKTEDNR